MRSFHRTLSFVAALSLVGAACGDDNGNGNGNEAPTANFEPPTCSGLTCTFTDASTDEDGEIASREWTFESGNPAESIEATEVVEFAAAGTYTVTLTVTDNEGATDDFSREVTVSGTPGNAAPTAAFTVECSALDCTFTNQSTDTDGTFTSSWDFGDGSPASTETSPVHSYEVTELTTFTVTLTVTDDAGDTDVATQEISVSPPADLTCADGSPDCELAIEDDAKVTVTLVSTDCELEGNTFKVIITPPGGGTPVEQTLFTDGCSEPPGSTYPLQSDAVFAAGTTITAQVISGGAVLELPPAVRVTPTSEYPEWTIEFDDGAQSEPPEPDFNDLVLTITAIPQP
jgi:PKD repeat protein